MLYYRKGLPSWKWFYPYHFSPLLWDVMDFISSYSQKKSTQNNNNNRSLSEEVDHLMEVGTPFLPFEQLMAVLPPLR
jgi:5'-3' exonuclease